MEVHEKARATLLAFKNEQGMPSEAKADALDTTQGPGGSSSVMEKKTRR